MNFPDITTEEARRPKPWVKLAEQPGSFAGQLTETSIKGVRLEHSGEVTSLNTKPLTAAALAGMLTEGAFLAAHHPPPAWRRWGREPTHGADANLVLLAPQQAVAQGRCAESTP